MNKILKTILQAVEVGAVSVVPGAAPIDSAVHNVIDHAKDGTGDTEQTVEQAILAALGEMEMLKPETIADPVTFNAEVAIAHDAILKAIAAVKIPPAKIA